MKQEWKTLTLLVLGNVINYMDRFTIPPVLDQIRNELSLTKSEEGFLQTAFLLSYLFFSPLFGFLGDRFCKEILIIISMSIWNLFSISGSFATSYGLLIGSRIGVGVGLAGFSSIAPSIIGNIFIEDKWRRIAFAVFYIAIPLGSGFGYILGWLGSKINHDWRWGLRIVPILGFIFIILTTFCIQYRKIERHSSNDGKTVIQLFHDYCIDVKSLAVNKTYVLIVIANTFVNFAIGAFAWWGPELLMVSMAQNVEIIKEHRNAPAFFGFIAIVTGLIGVPMGSYLSMVYRKYGYNRPDPLICGVGILFSTLFTTLLLTTAEFDCDVMLYTYVTLIEMFANLNWAVSTNMMIAVTQSNRRASANGLSLFFSHLFGDASSPYIIGLMTQELQKHYCTKFRINCDFNDIEFQMGPIAFESLRNSSYLLIIFLLSGGICFCFAYKTISKDLVDKKENIKKIEIT